ncbi:MAG: transposase [Planctomycetes bacterium]|nr:transposase [Planctomycetota bacterium]
MVLAYHLVLSAYGFWLPNDPRGSCSDFVGSKELFRFGKARKVDSRESTAHVEHDRQWRMAAKQSLKYPPVRFSGVQARAVGRGFAKAIEDLRVTNCACAMMPDHVHLVVGRSAHSIEDVSTRLKSEASRKLVDESLHPFDELRNSAGDLPSVWAEGEWKVFLNSPEAITHEIQYVEENPIKAGLKPQRWSFVTRYVPY